jgi:sugar transferase EpsL
MDLGVAVTGLVLLAPLMAMIALAIRVRMGSPVLFRHERPGYLGRPFHLLKFRTMRPEVAPDGRPLGLDERVTPLGAFLRRTSLDELPELWNVLRGEMSLVGPRPLLMDYLSLYSTEQARRHEVRPGITGLAQVSGRHELAWEERFRLDVWYVDHWTLREDLRILAATAGIALRGQATMDPGRPGFRFEGNAADRPTGDGVDVPQDPDPPPVGPPEDPR